MNCFLLSLVYEPPALRKCISGVYEGLKLMLSAVSTSCCNLAPLLKLGCVVGYWPGEFLKGPEVDVQERVGPLQM